tara:strand:- start:563 stop:763 length:201 start_codon:yes stop_codon:yes gene_type:complete
MGAFKRMLTEKEDMSYQVPDDIDIEYFIHNECENISQENYKVKFDALDSHSKKEVTLMAEQRVLGI